MPKHPFTPELLQRIRDNDPSLGEHLDLSWQSPKLTDNDIQELAEVLAENRAITSLDVRGNHIGDDGAKALAQIPTLTSLNVRYNKIGAAGAKALAENQTLTSLNVSANKIGAAGAEALAENRTLTSLDVRVNEIGDDGAKALAENQTLTSLDVSGNNIGDAGKNALCQMIQNNPNLVGLDILQKEVDKMLEIKNKAKTKVVLQIKELRRTPGNFLNLLPLDVLELTGTCYQNTAVSGRWAQEILDEKENSSTKEIASNNR